MRFRAFLPLIMLTVFATAKAQLPKEDAERERKLQEKALKLAADTSKNYGWHHVMVVGVNVSQVSFRDWAQGGENALSYTVFLNGSTALDRERLTLSNSYRFAFGQTRLGSQGYRKTDDEIYDEALLVYKVGSFLNPYASATFRTQFARGYTYDKDGVGTLVSRFLDPAYFTQSVGVGFRPIPQVTTRLGIAVREIFTSRFTRYANDPQKPSTRKTGVKGGMESVSETAWRFDDNLSLSSRLEIFAPLEQLERIYMRSDNMITARVYRFVSTSVGVQILHDLNASPRTQVKEVLAMGIAITIL